MSYTLLVDASGGQYSIEFTRASEAWAEFWHAVAHQPDDGSVLTGGDPLHLLAGRTGMAQGSAWSIYLIEN